jgi:prepilin-type N-terminal cleavage/methylation domain-containing protein
MRSLRTRGFTLIELLIVVAIISILATLILSGLTMARKRTMVARAKNEISQLKAALSMYDNEQGRFPRPPVGGTPNIANLLKENDIHWVYAALRNKPTLAAGGGPSAPYLEWKPENLGIAKPADLDAAGSNSYSDANPPPFASNPLSPEQIEKLDDVTTQVGLAPKVNAGTEDRTVDTYVFLDPWGSPYFYREWASVPESTKSGNGGTANPTTHTGIKTNDKDPGSDIRDYPHDPARFDIWSFGPNMVNEWGSGEDDIASWGEATKK